MMAKLADSGIETRPFFHPMHTLPMYQELAEGRIFPIAEQLAACGINLPSSATMSDEDVTFVCDELIGVLKARGA